MPLAAAVLLTLASSQIVPPPQYNANPQDPINWEVKKSTVFEKGEIVYVSGLLETENTIVTRSYHDGASLIYVLDVCYESFEITAQYLGSARYFFTWKSPFPVPTPTNYPWLYGRSRAMNSTGQGKLFPLTGGDAILTNRRVTTGPQGMEISIDWKKKVRMHETYGVLAVEVAGKADVIWDPIDSTEGTGAMSQWSTSQSMYSSGGYPLSVTR